MNITAFINSMNLLGEQLSWELSWGSNYRYIIQHTHKFPRLGHAYLGKAIIMPTITTKKMTILYRPL